VVGVIGVTFHDLRGTAATRLAVAGAAAAEIATITGHSLQSVRAILDTHYLARDPALGETPSVSSKEEQELPTDLGCSMERTRKA
jgi:integrase